MKYEAIKPQFEQAAGFAPTARLHIDNVMALGAAKEE